MYTLKSTLKRGMTLSAAIGLVVSSFASMVTPAFADALNPLTERSLTLSSSAPGWSKTDGSGNSTYAPPNSGANGQKTGNYFSFKVSTDSTGTPVKAMTFQYCTDPAGQCQAPGNNSGDAADADRGNDTATTSDLNIEFDTAAEVDNDDFGTVINTTGASAGEVKAVPGFTNNNPKYIASGADNDPAEAAKDVDGNFIVMYKSGTTWVQSENWTATAVNQEEATSGITGKNNMIILQNTGTGMGLPSGTQVKVLFFATDDDYITNPGAGAFFVKINTFSAYDDEDDLIENLNASPSRLIDGGVTVANVMNQSIQITTKVLETMQFSVGTVDPATLDETELGDSSLGKSEHGVCDTILMGLTGDDAQNVLELGNQNSESSLSTERTYATHSYWRLSSNSSAGATVYYSGHTLSNTSGDEIKAIGPSLKESAKGSEQFGLALATASLGSGSADVWNGAAYGVDYSVDPLYENAADNGHTSVDDSTLINNGALYDSGDDSWDYSSLNASFHLPRLDPLVPTANYGSGAGIINGFNAGDSTTPGDATFHAKFAFDTASDTVPTPIASEHSQVVDCVTGKMRYIANIAATTPAGIYTTKINYIAAPQY